MTTTTPILIPPEDSAVLEGAGGFGRTRLPSRAQQLSIKRGGCDQGVDGDDWR